MIGDHEHTKKLIKHERERAQLEPETKGLPRWWKPPEAPPRPTIKQQLHERVELMRESLAFSQRCLEAQNDRHPGCSTQVEQLQKHDDPAPTCSKCADTVNKLVRMTKQVSRTSFRLEGGGWARDGYKG